MFNFSYIVVVSYVNILPWKTWKADWAAALFLEQKLGLKTIYVRLQYTCLLICLFFSIITTVHGFVSSSVFFSLFCEYPAALMLPTAVAPLPCSRFGPAGPLLMAVSSGGDGSLGEHLFVDWRQQRSHCFHSCFGRGFNVLDLTLGSQGRLMRPPSVDIARPVVVVFVYYSLLRGGWHD